MQFLISTISDSAVYSSKQMVQAVSYEATFDFLNSLYSLRSMSASGKLAALRTPALSKSLSAFYRNNGLIRSRKSSRLSRSSSAFLSFRIICYLYRLKISYSSCSVAALLRCQKNSLKVFPGAKMTLCQWSSFCKLFLGLILSRVPNDMISISATIRITRAMI